MVAKGESVLRSKFLERVPKAAQFLEVPKVQEGE